MVRQIVIVRHGETEWSASGRHTSRTDLPLNDDGRRAASELAHALASYSFDCVLCSPSVRARETCRLAGLGDSASITDDLREWDYGDYEGLTTEQIREEVPSWWLWRDGCPGGEAPASVGARADQVLARLRDASGDAAVFAHGHILRVLAARWLEMEVAAGARFALQAGALSVLGFERATEVVTLWNWVP